MLWLSDDLGFLSYCSVDDSVGNIGPKVYALDAATGTVLWKYAASTGSSPLIANDVLYFGSEDSNVYALNARTGAPLWQYTTGAPIFSSPAVADGIVYVRSGDSTLYAFSTRRRSHSNDPNSGIISIRHTRSPGLKVGLPAVVLSHVIEQEEGLIPTSAFITVINRAFAQACAFPSCGNGQ